MRAGLLVAASLLAAPARAADPPDPPVVFQVQPLSRVLGDLRTAAEAVGGANGPKVLTHAVREALGEKGLEGLDVNRPVVGYVVLAPKPEDITAVLALPVTGEKEFLDMCERANGGKPRADGKDKGLHHLPPLDPRYKAVMRFADQYAYIAYGSNPLPHADPKALVPMPRLYDPADRGLVSGRIHFGRIPADVKFVAPALLNKVKDDLLGGLRLGAQENELLKPVVAEVEKLVARYAVLADGADTLSARVYLDPAAGALVAEANLTAKPGSALAKVVAAYKPAPNAFAALTAHPDTAAAFHTRVPLFAPELKAAAAGGFEAAGKQQVGRAPEVDKKWTDELFKGLARTAKATDGDIAVAFRGPDKDGWFTVVGAAVFDDPAALEKEAIASFKADAPKEEQDRMKWDADKAGKVRIHTYHFAQGGFLDFTRVLGGEKCFAAFAFAPGGVVGAVGPDPVPVLKGVLAAKPADAPSLEFVANPARVYKAFEKGFGPGDPKLAEIADALGKDDKPLPVMSLVVAGGGELRATLTVNLRTLPRLMFHEEFRRAAERIDRAAKK